MKKIQGVYTGPEIKKDVPFPKVLIRSLGISCAAGDQPFALLGAVGASLSGAVPHPVLTIGQDEEDAPALYAPVPWIDDIEDPEERIAALAEDALKLALNGWSGAQDWTKVLVCTLISEAELSDELEGILREVHPDLEHAAFRFVPQEQGAADYLHSLGKELAAGAWEAVIFGGAESLVDAQTCRQLMKEDRLMSLSDDEGTIPGEGAAYLVLQRADSPQSEQRLPVITGVASSAEPFAGQADTRKLTALSDAVREVTAAAGLDLTRIDGFVWTVSSELLERLEVYHVKQQLWPPRDPQPCDLTELFLQVSLGNTGAAAFPLALALACARLEFHHPPAKNLIITEIQGNLRGAACLNMGA